MTDTEKNFIEELKKQKGIVGAACRSIGISRTTFYRWKKRDRDFAEAADDAISGQVDYVEDKLLDLIETGNAAAIIFYMKTKGRDRGYGEKYVPEIEREEPEHKVDPKAAKIMGGVKAAIIKALKNRGTYDPGLTFQIEIAAMIYTKLRLMKAEIFDKNHHTIIIEKSREGNNRETASPLEAQFKQYLSAAQSAFRALGLNTDSKQKMESDDGFGDFMEAMSEDK